MSNEKTKNSRKIAHLTGHDYSGGAYFVSVCTKNREHFFGEITVETGHAASVCENEQTERTGHAPSLQMTEIGQCLYDNLQNVAAHYLYAEIPLFVVMPNHWHGIVFIDGNKTPYIRRNNIVGTGRAPSVCENEQMKMVGACPDPTGKNEHMQKIDSFKGWLSVAIGGIKSAVTKFARDNDIDFAWQTRFHDHIIRDREEMNRIADYIENNPARWDNDCYNKINDKNAARHSVGTWHAASLQ